jgi:hypothetical protein
VWANKKRLASLKDRVIEVMSWAKASSRNNLLKDSGEQSVFSDFRKRDDDGGNQQEYDFIHLEARYASAIAMAKSIEGIIGLVAIPTHLAMRVKKEHYTASLKCVPVENLTRPHCPFAGGAPRIVEGYPMWADQDLLQEIMEETKVACHIGTSWIYENTTGGVRGRSG